MSNRSLCLFTSNDKIDHFITGFLLCVIIYAGFRIFFTFTTGFYFLSTMIMLSMTPVLTLAIGKEIYDYTNPKKNTEFVDSIFDVVATIGGGIVALVGNFLLDIFYFAV